MNYQNNRQFSTKDRDNDDCSSAKCAEYRHGGFGTMLVPTQT